MSGALTARIGDYSLDGREIFLRFFKYIFEGLVIALVAYLIPNNKLKAEEILILALTAAAAFAILDHFFPAYGASLRSGAGWGMGFNLVGFPGANPAAMRAPVHNQIKAGCTGAMLAVEQWEKLQPYEDEEMRELGQESDDEKVLARVCKSKDPVVQPKTASSEQEALENLDRMALRGDHQREAGAWMLSIEFAPARTTSSAPPSPSVTKRKGAAPRRGRAASASSGPGTYATADLTGFHPDGSPVHGGILGDPVGFGKTFMVLAVVAANPKRPTLVVTLPATLDMWGRTAAEFTGLSCCYMGALAAEVPEGTDIVVATYNSIRSDNCAWAKDTRWGRIVLDEGHFIRNSATVTFRALMQLTADSRWVLTATPIHNGLKDLKSLYSWIGFDTGVMSEHDLRGLNDRFLLARTVEAERKRNDHLNLPPLEVVDVLHDMRDDEKDAYKRLLQEHEAAQNAEAQAAKKRQRSEAPPQEEAQAPQAQEKKAPATRSSPRLACMANMRTLCVVGHAKPPAPPPPPPPPVTNGGIRNSADAGMLAAGMAAAAGGGDAGSVAAQEERRPATAAEARMMGLYNPQEEERQRAQEEAVRASRPASSKMDLTVQLVVEDLQDPEAKIVVFTTYLKEKDVIMEALSSELAAKEASCVCIHGSMPLAQRNANMAAFTDDPLVRVIVAQMRCASTGINLQAANRVIITSPDYNPCVEKQAIGRVHRQGQTRPVLVRRLVARDSIEERCLAIQARKIAIIEKNVAACTREGERAAVDKIAAISQELMASTNDVNASRKLAKELRRQMRLFNEGCDETVDLEDEVSGLMTL